MLLALSCFSITLFVFWFYLVAAWEVQSALVIGDQKMLSGAYTSAARLLHKTWYHIRRYYYPPLLVHFWKTSLCSPYFFTV
jgi:hypothetical protein